MKKLMLSLAILSLISGNAWGGSILGTSNPPGTPLSMTAGTISGSMLVNVVGTNADVMAAWNVQLAIIPNAGTAGTLSFQSPASGTPSNPPNYIFGSSGLGIAATNGGNLLSANDFLDPSVGAGVAVPGTPGANLLQLSFLSSPDASGLFGIYAVQGAALTQWSDSNFTTQFFTNVPDGTGLVRIGDVLVTSDGPQAVPEPSSLVLFGLAGATMTIWGWRRTKRKQASP